MTRGFGGGALRTGPAKMPERQGAINLLHGPIFRRCFIGETSNTLSAVQGAEYKWARNKHMSK